MIKNEFTKYDDASKKNAKANKIKQHITQVVTLSVIIFAVIFCAYKIIKLAIKPTDSFLIEQGKVEKIKYGYYQWQDEKAFTEVSVITSLFPKAIICDMSAAMYYGYTDRVPGVWHIAVDNKSARNKFKLDFPIIKPHFIEASRLNIGVSEGNIDEITVKIYDRERVVCDCLRHVNTMDGEVFNTVIQRYISDKEKDAAKLMMYASKLGVEKKARRVVGVWL